MNQGQPDIESWSGVCALWTGWVQPGQAGSRLEGQPAARWPEYHLVGRGHDRPGAGRL